MIFKTEYKITLREENSNYSIKQGSVINKIMNNRNIGEKETRTKILSLPDFCSSSLMRKQCTNGKCIASEVKEWNSYVDVPTGYHIRNYAKELGGHPKV